MLFYKIFLEHPLSTNNPQGYWCHGFFSVFNSLKGVWYMTLDIVHGLLPILFPFATSSFLIRTFAKLVQENRHQEEMRKYITAPVLEKLNDQLEMDHWN